MSAHDIYEQLFEFNPRPMWVFDRDTMRFLLVNAAACEHYGWTRDEFATMTIRDIRPPEEVPRLEATFAATKGEACGSPKSGRHRTKDGRVIDVELELQPITFRGRPGVLVVVDDVTGLREAERRNQLLVETASDGVCLTDADYTLRYISPGGARMLGFEPSDLIGKPWHVMSHPDDIAELKPILPGETRDLLTRARHRDGNWRWVEATTTNLTLDPAVRAFVASFRDVTARVEAERELHEAYDRLEFLMTATLAVTYVARPHGHGSFGGTFVSASVRDVLGWEPEDFTDSTTFWLDNIHPDDRAGVEAGLQHLLETGAHKFDYRFRHRDGSYRWIHDAARVVEPPGRTTEIVGCMVDITERMRAAESVARSEANFRVLIERSPTAMLVHREGTLLYVNPAGVTLLGYDTADQLIGTSVLDLIHPEDQPLIRARIEHIRVAGSTPPREARMRRRDGSYVIVEGEGHRLEFDGELANVVMGRDVNERNEMFARMAVADRMLSVGTLAAGVAHEINNPLSYVVSNLAMLATELPLILSDDPRHQSRLSKRELEQLLLDAREGAARVSAIVRDLRALSRSDDTSAGPIDVAGVLASSIKMAFNEIRHRARVIERYGPAPLVQANATRLGQVFLNMLVNAAQAIPEGSADSNEIRVRVVPSEGRREVIVEIEDTGVGIPANVIGRIFDPFFTTKPIGLGVGLGLAISHQIIRSLGGTIEVASTPMQGTRFRIVLPAAARQTIAVPPPVEATTTASARVLMIDDEPGVGRSTKMLLSPEYEIMPVTRAREGLDLLAGGERFDAILCDLMMPEMSGIEFYHQLSRSAPDYASRVVFLTGGAFTQQARDFLASVSQPHIDKPFEEDDLRRAIERVRGG